MPALSSGNEWHLQHALTWNNRRGVGFFLCWLEDQLIESYIFLVNWLNNGVFGENVGSCTQVSDEAVLKPPSAVREQFSLSVRTAGHRSLCDLAVPRVIYILLLRARSTKLLS